MAHVVLVEPHAGGHRFQWAEWVARVALGRGDDVTLLTSAPAAASKQMANFLAPLDLTVIEAFDTKTPSAVEIGAAIAAAHSTKPIDVYVILDSDRILPRWWRVAPRALRRRGQRPEAVLVMTRFPPRPAPWEVRLFVERLAKGAACLLARARGVGDRAAYVAPRNDRRRGWLFRPLRDPAICTAHSRDRAALRARLGLPPSRALLGVVGSVTGRKNVPIVLGAALEAGPDVDVVMAGHVQPDVLAWFEALPADQRARVHGRIGFLPDADLDAYVAASDIIVCAHSNPGPSGIMGKAQVAEVPVLSAGSRVRRREAAEVGVGLHTEMTPEAMAVGIRTLLASPAAPAAPADLPTGDEFGARVLGLPDPVRHAAPR